MKILYYIVLSLLVSLSFIRCVKEDMSGCTPLETEEPGNDRILHFQLIPRKYNFKQEVENLQLYAYSDTENPPMAFSRDFSAAQLAAQNYTLPWGDWVDTEHYDYHLMGVLNDCEDYKFENINSLKAFQTHIQPTFDDIRQEELSDIFVGYFDLNSRTRTVSNDTLYLEKLTNRIFVTVEFRGFELETGSELETRISGNNAKYDYQNNCLESCFMNYLPYNRSFIEDRSYFSFDIVTGKLYIGDDLRLYLELFDEEHNLENITSFMVVDYISRIQDQAGNYLYNTNEKLREEDEFYIHIVINEEFTIVEMNINNWYWVNPGIDL